MTRLMLLAVCLGAGCALAQSPPDPFADYLATPIPPADGFDFPVGHGEGTGFKVSTRLGEAYELGLHTGEDWNGVGGGNTDLGAPVQTIGAGKVVVAGELEDPWGGVVVIEHLFYEGADKRMVRSLYAHLSRIDVAEGDEVARGQRIGAIGRDPGKRFFAHLHLEIRADLTLAPTFWPSSHGWSHEQLQAAYLDPSRFISERRQLFVPQREPVALLVDHATFKLRVLRHGLADGDYEIALGQGEGFKTRRGDLRTPRGMYFVAQRSRGPFGGDYADYYGGFWVKVNYPGPLDAERGVAEGLITSAQARQISALWRSRKLTLEKTALGGGIGFHGWTSDWEGPGARLSWGCVVMHNGDLEKLYDRIPEGSLVVFR